METTKKTKEELIREMEQLRLQLEEANETIEAIRTGQVDALIVQETNGHKLYTLKTADQTYRVFIEKMAEGAVTVNADGVILYCNSQFATMVQMKLSSVIGLSFIDFVATEDQEYYKNLFARCWEHDCKGEILLKADKSFTPVQLSLATLELDGGISLSIILTDLTRQKETQRQLIKNNEALEQINRALEASNHDLQQFASVASHDLQEPLRKIQMFSYLLKENHQTELSNEFKKYLDKIIDSSYRMKSLIIDILNYSKLSVNHNNYASVDLNAVVKELLKDFELLIQEKNATIGVDELPCINVNRGQIRQVFQNIVSNALKFSKPEQNPVISITAKRIRECSFDSEMQTDGAFCSISIKDNGIGFDEQYVTNIFTLFERLHTKDKYEGTGIGLAIAKKIIDKHNGLITARSIKGQGSEFIIILPVSQPEI